MADTMTGTDSGELLTVLTDNDESTIDPEKLGLGDEDLVAMYRHIAEIRVIDNRMMTLQRQGRLGFYLTSYGEEATHVGSTYALEHKDLIWPCYRENGAGFVRGMPLEDYVHQCFGSAKDPHKGRQMPNHWGYPEGNVVTISSPVGTQISQAAGGAMGSKFLKDGSVTLVYFGDGATSQGDFHVGMNFAGVYKAPCIFFCRNNGYAISVPTEKQTAVDNFSLKAIGYGMPGVRVDGNDILAVYKATLDAATRGRNGEGPTFIEAVTYRRGAHSSSDDPTVYRTREEEAEWDRKCPVARFRRFLEKRDLWDDDQQQDLETSMTERLKRIINEAEDAGPPDRETLFEDVYEGTWWRLEDQREALFEYLDSKEGK